MAASASHLLYVGTRSKLWPHLDRLTEQFDALDGLVLATRADSVPQILHAGRAGAVLVEAEFAEQFDLIETIRRHDPDVPILLVDASETSAESAYPGPTSTVSIRALTDRPAEILGRIEDLGRHGRPSLGPDDLEVGLLLFERESGRVAFANRTACTMHGYRRTELLEASIDRLFGSEPPYTPRELREWLQRADDEGPQLFEWLTRSKDGSTIPVEVHLRRRSEDPRYAQALLYRVGQQQDRLTDLEREHAFQNRALDTVTDLFFICTADGEMTHWTQRAVEITGYEHGEIGSMHPTDFVIEDDRSRVRRLMDKIVGGERVRTEVSLSTKEGRRVPYEFTGAPLQWGETTYICGIGRNVTERSRTEQALRQSERRYRRLFEDSRDAIAITTPEGAIIDANKAARDLLGYSREEFPDLNAASVYANPARREEIRETLDHQGFVRDEEVRFVTKEGEELVCLLTMSVRRDENGHIEAYQSIFRDITERKRGEEALQESEEKFRTLAEKSLVGVYLVQDGLFKYINPRGADMLDYEPEELIEQHGPKKITHPEDWPLVAENLQRRLSGQEDAINYSFRAVTKHQETIFVEVYGVRIRYQGRPAILGTALDQTEQRRLEQELVQVQEEERRRISQDLHDGLASKLSGIEMVARTLARRVESGGSVEGEELEEIADLVHEGNEEVHRLAEGLNPIEVKKHGLTGALRELVEASGQKETLDLSFEQEGPAPELEEEVATHLYRVAQEALENATRHADARHAAIRLRHEENRLDLLIEDDGSGFDPTDPPSEGMGLHTMRYRADLVGGDLQIEERPSGGTIVRCSLTLSAGERVTK